MVVGRAIEGLYHLDLNKKCPEVNSLVLSSGFVDLSHARLGHIYEATTRCMIQPFNLPVSIKVFVKCSSCVMGKMHRIHSPFRPKNSAHDVLEIVYADLRGPSPVPSIEGHQFYINFVDGYSKFNWLFPIFRKSNVVGVFKKFKTMVEKQTGKVIKSIQIDNGGEFVAFIDFLESSDISHQCSCPYAHYQMGTVEWQHRHIVDTGLSLIHHARLPLCFWKFAFSAATFLYNRHTSSVFPDEMPYERVFGQIPNLKGI